jgi:hypothetical protein
LRPCEPATIPLGTGGLDALFPDGGLSAGSLVELLPSAAGAGAWTLALILARYACGERKTLLIADHERVFYPPAARKLGFDPERTVIVRPRRAADALLALAQALRCPAIGTAIGAFEYLNDRDGRRLQLAAESSGAIGILLRPLSALGMPSFATIRLRLDPLPSSLRGRRLRLEVLRCRSASPLPLGEGPGVRAEPSETSALTPNPSPRGRGEKDMCVEIDHATSHVRLLSPLELAADSPRSTRSTG